MEKHYVFLKENRVKNIAVFLEPDEHLAAQVAAENGWDDAIWIEETPPHIHSYWNGTSFELPTDEYLFNIGVIKQLPKPEVEEPVSEETQN